MDTAIDQQLASDNYSGACPEVMAALFNANHGYVSSYGEDSWTQAACDRIREVFETDCEVFFVFNGTAANALSLAQLCAPFHSVIAADVAHIETDECGAPEFFSGGSKILSRTAVNGKLTPEDIHYWVGKRSDIHYPKPRVVTLTQSTELGTVYTVEELQALSEAARNCGLAVQMDGSRFANAVAYTGASPADLSWRSGVDVLALGGTKNGGMIGEAVLFFRRKLGEDFAYRCKQGGQLASKLRFLSAPWLGLLQDSRWLANAAHANAMAARLAQQLAAIPGVELRFPVEANAVFVNLPGPVQTGLLNRGWHFYTFIGGSARLMCSWNTRIETIDRFAADCAELAGEFNSDPAVKR